MSATLDAVEAALDGRTVSDFEASFPIVRRALDLRSAVGEGPDMSEDMSYEDALVERDRMQVEFAERGVTCSCELKQVGSTARFRIFVKFETGRTLTWAPPKGET